MGEVTHPVLRWHGGKWRLAPWIIAHFPDHEIYVEPFGGGGSVLLRKCPVTCEVWNDLDGDAVNLFRVLRSDRAGELVEALRLTPFSRVEFRDAYLPSDDPVERARRLVIRSFQGFSTNGHAKPTGFRSKGIRAGGLPQHAWGSYPDALALIIERLRAGVIIESEPALDVMARYDGESCLHYVDPPYLDETRGRGATRYAHEMTDADHAELLAFLRTLTGMVVLSGYPSPLYDSALHDWHRVERAALADGARERTEVLWINAAAGRRRPVMDDMLERTGAMA